MVHKVYSSNEVYVYMNGSLLYKRWFTGPNGHGYGMVFCDVWGNRPFTCRDTISFKSIIRG
jgi:hypothetical protein